VKYFGREPVYLLGFIAALLQALAHDQNAREQAEARQPLVESVSATLRRAREENHFREKIEALFRGAAHE
jgi:hypothetical protein